MKQLPMTQHLLAATLVLGVSIAGVPAFAEEPSLATWHDLEQSIFASKPITASPIVALDAPYRAEDAAIVPMTIHLGLPPGDTRSIDKVTLLIDENPSPVAAVFTLGKDAGVTRIETRVRVNSYTYVHAVAELSDGSLVMAERYVKAAGGCSAPAVKSLDSAMSTLGQMKFRQFPPADTTDGAKASGLREAQLMIRHPNNTGMQMDQVSLNYIPARYIDDLEIDEGKAAILRVTGGISLSEDPTIRFSYRPNGGADFSAKAVDTDGTVFTGSWPVQNGS